MEERREISSVEKEFIFKFLTQNKIKFEIRCKNKTTYATLLKHTSKEMQMELSSVLEELTKENTIIDLFFYFQNNYHMFRSKILKIQGNLIIIENPEKIAKNPQRKFERKYLGGKLDLQFKIRGDLIALNFPKTSVSYYPNKPPIEADFFDVKIEKIIQKFNDKMTNIVTFNKIKMLRNQMPSAFEESMIIKYGRILYVPDVYSELPQKQLLPNISIFVKGDWLKFETLKNKTPAYMVNKVISKYLVDMSKNNILSKAIIPILYRNYVVGLIYLINDLKSRKSISLKVLNYAFQFSRLASYALKENGYFIEEEKNTKTHDLPIYDFSPGGLAVEVTDNSYEDKLLLNHNIEIILNIDENEIKITAKIVRKFKNDGKYYYGFMYIDIKKPDFDFLIEYYNNI